MSSQVLKAASATNTYNITNPEDGTFAITKGETSPTTVLGLSTNGITSFGGQLKFPATQNASADANTLDDYEEGTFTPTVVGTSTAGTGTYSYQLGQYVKIGKLVFFNLYISQTNHTGTGNIQISGLPFTMVGGWFGWGPSAVVVQNLSMTAGNVLMPTINSGTTSILLFQGPSGGGGLSQVPMDTAFELGISGCYIASA